MLVVIGMTITIVSIVSVTYLKTNFYIKKISCISNLKSLQTATLLYYQEHADFPRKWDHIIATNENYNKCPYFRSIIDNLRCPKPI